MKQIKRLIAAATIAIALIAVQTDAATVTVVSGGQGTNKTVKVANVTYAPGVFPGASTNVFNLAQGIGTQSDTNAWPSGGDPLIGYPGTLYGPSRVITITANGQLTTGTGTVPLVFALSNDGTLWVTNALTFTYTLGSPALSNIDTYAANYICLQQIANTNAGALTNLVIQIGEKPGL